jgi:hypothetical protein
VPLDSKGGAKSGAAPRGTIGGSRGMVPEDGVIITQ